MGANARDRYDPASAPASGTVLATRFTPSAFSHPSCRAMKPAPHVTVASSTAVVGSFTHHGAQDAVQAAVDRRSADPIPEKRYDFMTILRIYDLARVL
jgi:hypothetical protein